MYSLVYYVKSVAPLASEGMGQLASNKFKTENEKFFGWAAQVGGMAGLIHSIFFAISSMDIGAMLCKKKNEEEAEENENGIEMTNDNMNDNPMKRTAF